MTPPPEAPVQAECEPRVVRVLVIDSDDSGKPLLDGVADSKFRVVRELRSVAEAALALDEGAADLVLADLGEDPMRTIDELSRHIASGDTVPFVAVARAWDPEIDRHALRIGMQDCLVRDEFSPAALERTMCWALERARELRVLRQDNDLFLTLLDHVPDRIYFKDRESRFVRVSRSVAQAHGFDDPAALIGESDFAFYPADQAEETQRDEQRVMETAAPVVGKVARRTLPDGSDVWVSSTKLPLEDRRGRVVGTFGITRDVTELKRLEIALADERNRLDEANRSLTGALENLQRAHAELSSVQLQLIEAEKLKSIGRLAAGVAHEVKNPLAILSMGIEFLAARHADDEASANVLKELADAVGRADGVIRGMLDFSTPGKLELQPCDLGAIVRTALRLVRGEIRKADHRVEVRIDEIPLVEADRVKTCQVFVNLLTNALHAMPEGGALMVRAGVERAGDGQGTFQPGEEIVVVEIADTGSGIPPHVLEKIFDPFVTTKAAGKGTGLGMSIVRSIMNLQRGTVSIRNRESGGAIATVTFRSIRKP